MKKNNVLSHEEVSRLGGRAIVALHGKNYFKELGRRGAAKRKENKRAREHENASPLQKFTNILTGQK